MGDEYTKLAGKKERTANEELRLLELGAQFKEGLPGAYC
jgi:hypothetical protein